MITPTDVLIGLHQALEAGEHGAALAAHFTDDAITVEHPNLIAPRGGRHDLPAVLAGSELGAALLSDQQYRIHSIDEVNTMVVARLTWTGTIRATTGPFKGGQQIVAHIAQFATVRDGRIAHLETFDCYEPWTDPRP
ncbi:MAG: nuclear transport factor 2 family protein [Mycetocola sp.]